MCILLASSAVTRCRPTEEKAVIFFGKLWYFAGMAGNKSVADEVMGIQFESVINRNTI
ncbi:MAG: hypothetical protein IPM69_03635 [Ignavibacteria bacterium]|nr:hypothetical protein [Ignavibacteria bacterium]